MEAVLKKKKAYKISKKIEKILNVNKDVFY
jgi:hypothetical protein